MNFNIRWWEHKYRGPYFDILRTPSSSDQEDHEVKLFTSGSSDSIDVVSGNRGLSIAARNGAYISILGTGGRAWGRAIGRAWSKRRVGGLVCDNFGWGVGVSSTVVCAGLKEVVDRRVLDCVSVSHGSCLEERARNLWVVAARAIKSIAGVGEFS